MIENTDDSRDFLIWLYTSEGIIQSRACKCERNFHRLPCCLRVVLFCIFRVGHSVCAEEWNTFVAVLYRKSWTIHTHVWSELVFLWCQWQRYKPVDFIRVCQPTFWAKKTKNMSTFSKQILHSLLWTVSWSELGRVALLWSAPQQQVALGVV